MRGVASAIAQTERTNTAMQNSGVLVPQSRHTFTDTAAVMAANVFALPNSITVSLSSAAGVGAVATRVYLFNQDKLSNITDNGSGANSITYTYQDGFGGNVVSELLAMARAGVGAVCYGVAIRANVIATGAGSSAALATTNPAFYNYNALGGRTDTNFNITAEQTRGDFDTSISLFRCIANVPRFSQFSLIATEGITYTCTFYFTPDFTV